MVIMMSGCATRAMVVNQGTEQEQVIVKPSTIDKIAAVINFIPVP